MNTKDEIGKLTQDVQYLLDRLAIKDCAARHARGCDRYDSDMLANVYHADGVDEHGNTINPGPKYTVWANAAHEAAFRLHQHHICQQTCEIDGDVAHCETYVVGMFHDKDGKIGRILGGRYIDRFERRNGEWRIVIRRSPVEGALAGDASLLSSPVFQGQGYIKGMKDKRDLSYARPLTLKSPADLW
jgi:SnoaL-like domain